MGLGEIFLSVIILFLTIFFAVRLAINPLLHQEIELPTDKRHSDLVKLRDMDVLSNAELEEVIELHQKKNQKKHDNEKYQRFAQILNELEEMGYFTNEQTRVRMDKLRAYLNFD